jgi:hypothetical protein
MYCDAIRKKDEMTKQISTWSSAGLCARTHCDTPPTINYHYLTRIATQKLAFSHTLHFFGGSFAVCGTIVILSYDELDDSIK